MRSLKNPYLNTLKPKYENTNLPIWIREDKIEVWITYDDGYLYLVDGNNLYSLSNPDWVWLSKYYPDIVKSINPKKYHK